LRWKILILVIFSVILFGAISASAVQHPPSVELEQTFLSTQFEVGTVFEHTWRMTNTGDTPLISWIAYSPSSYTSDFRSNYSGCTDRYNNFAIISCNFGTLQPGESSPTIILKYHIDSIGVWQAQGEACGEVQFPERYCDKKLDIITFVAGTDPTPDPEPTPIDPMTEQRLTDLEQRMDVQEQEWMEFKIKTKAMFP